MKTDFPGHHWWLQLTPQWKQAFAETFFRHDNEPTPSELAQLYASPVLRLAGPSAPYPNMSLELPDLSGIMHLINLETLVVTYHQVETIRELKFLTRLKSLFLFNNKIKSLEGIEVLTNLEQLYVQYNCIESMQPIQNLTNLKELYIHDNLITSFEGLTEEHADKLENFFCKPNDGIRQKEVLRVERELGIRCKTL